MQGKFNFLTDIFHPSSDLNSGHFDSSSAAADLLNASDYPPTPLPGYT